MKVYSGLADVEGTYLPVGQIGTSVLNAESLRALDGQNIANFAERVRFKPLLHCWPDMNPAKQPHWHVVPAHHKPNFNDYAANHGRILA